MSGSCKNGDSCPFKHSTTVIEDSSKKRTKDKFKSEMCKNQLEFGVCFYGRKCTYRHSTIEDDDDDFEVEDEIEYGMVVGDDDEEDELVGDDSNDEDNNSGDDDSKQKPTYRPYTKPCFDWLKGQACQRGDTCTYLHCHPNDKAKILELQKKAESEMKAKLFRTKECDCFCCSCFFYNNCSSSSRCTQG
ncbi:hypothetical protein SAMD00019534_007220 [Acytostelium subglobosum LB1]|uniref:hypothetical protein n=1 Tax=Acytostelium subglobosum LB1 TaxID=1410327 RepID=UPI000644D181|nr:hypothetical protein SAMD00019534_007220 [Acytostelium subglobosum LB1]GAM17547.1 hypothetical protein SAMD00019534_007220 [Acytostelium subglobosum LB1]|eukprot:XP_012759609.1 hypothetical protein SAMD00019534_007220 [Acytostelium subglobosum LB1]